MQHGAEGAADEEFLAAVVRETRRVRAARFAASLVPGAVVSALALVLGSVWMLVGGVVALLGLAWQARSLGPLPGGRLSLFARHALDHVTFSGVRVYVTCDGRRVRLFGPAAASGEFRQVLRRRWPQLPQLVSVLPIAG